MQPVRSDRAVIKAVAGGLAIVLAGLILLVSPLRAGPQVDTAVATSASSWNKMDVRAGWPSIPAPAGSQPGTGSLPAEQQPLALAEAGISGHISSGGLAAAGVTLVLRMYDSLVETSVLTTTTGADGSYLFSSVPSLPAGKIYYVRFGPNGTNPSYVAIWYGPDILGYVSGQSVPGGDFDIANVVLQFPPGGSTRPLPAAFSWNLRNVPTDSYQWVLQMGGTAWASDPLGYVTQYTLLNLPQGAAFGQPYYWLVVVSQSGSGSFGLSYYMRQITLAPADSTTATPTPTATRSPTATATPHTAITWLPVIMSDRLDYFMGPWEHEDNSTPELANGPLRTGVAYYGHPNDQYDYYDFYVPQPGQILVSMTTDTPRDMQLLLYREWPTDANFMTYRSEPPYQIATGENTPAGWYYVVVYTAPGAFSTSATYTLRVVVFP